jgi:hypothetical protein
MDATRITCPACGFVAEYRDNKAPKHGRATCESCLVEFDVAPLEIPLAAISFASGREIDEGAAQVRQLVERIRKGE